MTQLHFEAWSTIDAVGMTCATPNQTVSLYMFNRIENQSQYNFILIKFYISTGGARKKCDKIVMPFCEGKQQK